MAKSEAEYKSELDSLRMFLHLAKRLLKDVDIDDMLQQCNEFDAFGCIFEPTLWIDKRKESEDLKDWLKIIAPLKVKMDDFEKRSANHG